MTREAFPKLLVVSSTDDREELVATLRERGFDQIHTGDGSGDTLAQARSIQPDVVVLCAGLEHADARALAGALRREEEGVPIVLVGQRSGPVKNALDAAAFEVDQFVGQPLSAKALAYAVTRAAQASKPPRDPIDRATDVAIDDIVRETLASLPAAPEGGEPAEQIPGEAEVAGPRDFGVSERGLGGGEPSADGSERLADPAAAQPRADAEEAEEEVIPPWREPTMVLEEGTRGDPAVENLRDNKAAPAPAPAAAASPKPSRIGLAELAALDAADRTPGGEASAFDVGDSSASAPGAGDFDASDSGVSDSDEASDLEAEHRPEIEKRESPSADAGDGFADGFAEELRRKMSQMAQRLFPEQRAERGPPVDLGVAHSAHTEIDLAQLGVDTVVGERDDANLIGGEFSPSPTFADAETHVPADSRPEGTPPSDPGTSESGAESQARGALGGAGEDVATILAERYRAEFTGHVVFRRQEAEKRVHFVEGRPVFATSNVPHDRMGELLCREGKITREQHARCWQAVVDSGRRMGEILVEMGCLKRRELLPAVRRHVEDIIYSLFAWGEGEYVAVPEDIASGEKIRLSRHPAAIILEGVRRKYTWPVLEEALGTEDAIVVTGMRERIDEILASADLSPAERGFVTSLTGERTLGEAAEEKGLEPLLGYQLAFGMMALGAAGLLHKGGESRPDHDTARAPSLVGETDLAIDRQRVLAKRSLVDEADYFTLLGVRRDATRFEIRRAYEAARREYAPGSFPAEVREELGSDIEEINQLLDEAFHVLDDDNLRTAYLAHLLD